MKVRTIRRHQNGHGDSFVKNLRKQYELPEREAQNLIRAGLVEAVKPAPVEPDED